MEPNNASRRKPSSGRSLLLAVLAAFLAGGALAGWVMWNTLQSETTGTAVSPQAAKAPGGGLSPSPTPLSTTSVRPPRKRPANWYSDKVSGTGVTAPRMVAGSAPKATAIGNGWPGLARANSRKSSAPPRWASQRMMTSRRPITCCR
jgi:hypothetical protein